MTCDFQQCGILTSVDSDEPVQPSVKLRNSKVCSVCSLTVIEYSSDKQRALIRLCVCAGWSEPLLVAHTTLLEISCHGSYIYETFLVPNPYDPFRDMWSNDLRLALMVTNFLSIKVKICCYDMFIMTERGKPGIPETVY